MSRTVKIGLTIAVIALAVTASYVMAGPNPTGGCKGPGMSCGAPRTQAQTTAAPCQCPTGGVCTCKDKCACANCACGEKCAVRAQGACKAAGACGTGCAGGACGAKAPASTTGSLRSLGTAFHVTQ